MKILIIAPSWIGDVVMSHSLYQLLYVRYFKKIKIDIVVSEWCADAIGFMPEINKIFVVPNVYKCSVLSVFLNFGKILKNNRYQQAIVLPNSFKSAFIPVFAGIAKRTGWRGEMRYGLLNDLRKLNKESFPLMVQRYSALAYENSIMQHFSDLLSPLPWPTFNVKKKR